MNTTRELELLREIKMHAEQALLYWQDRFNSGTDESRAKAHAEIAGWSEFLQGIRHLINARLH